MLKKIAVLGGGNGAHAMAADLTLKGLEVNMCEAPQFLLDCGLPRFLPLVSYPPAINWSPHALLAVVSYTH